MAFTTTSTPSGPEPAPHDAQPLNDGQRGVPRRQGGGAGAARRAKFRTHHPRTEAGSVGAGHQRVRGDGGDRGDGDERGKAGHCTIGGGCAGKQNVCRGHESCHCHMRTNRKSIVKHRKSTPSTWVAYASHVPRHSMLHIYISRAWPRPPASGMSFIGAEFHRRRPRRSRAWLRPPTLRSAAYMQH